MIIEDPDQRLDREVIAGTGASSSRDGAGHEQEATGRPIAMSEPQPRPAEPSVGEDQPPREQSDDADMAILAVTGGTQRVGCGRKRNEESQHQCP